MQTTASQSLASLGKGLRVNVRLIDGGLGVKGKLSSMGIMPGVTIEILKNSVSGPIIVKVMGAQLALGRAMAEKISVAQSPCR